MPTNRKRTTRKIAKNPLLDFVRILLMDGPDACHVAMVERRPGTGKAESFRMRKDKGRTQAAWIIHRDEILRIWKAEKRKGKPWGARVFDID